MTKAKEISPRRAELLEEEMALLSELEDQSLELERKFEKIAKRSLIIGSGILLGYAIYRGISGEKSPSKKSNNTIQIPVQGKKQGKRTNIGRQVLGQVVKKGISLLLDSMKVPTGKS